MTNPVLEQRRAAAAQESAKMLKDLPPEAMDLFTLQLKWKWTKADHARVKKLTAAWSDVHKQVFTDRFEDLLRRPIRWE